MIIRLLLLFCALPLAAHPLMVMIDPMGADIFLDGERLEERSPAIIRIENPGTYSLEITKSGYAPLVEKIEISDRDEVTVFDRDLRPLSVELLRTDQAEGHAEGVQRFGFEDYEQIELRLTPEGTGELRPAYPRTRLLYFTDMGVPVAGLAAALLGASEIASPTDNRAVSVNLIGAGAAFLAFLSLNLYLHHDEREFYRKAEHPSLGYAGTRAGARDRYATAQRLITAEAYRGAERELEELIRETPQSRYIPRAFYSLSRIAIQEGDLVAAEQQLRRIVEELPDPAVYDLACKSLADVLITDNRTAEAVEALEMMLFADETYSREIIKQYKAALTADYN